MAARPGDGGRVTRTTGRWLAAAAVILASTAACADHAEDPPGGSDGAAADGAAADGTDDGTTTDTIAWEDCGGGVECARVEVPVDYDEPDGDTLTLSVSRAPATGDRIGALFVNPGGPGGTATDVAANLAPRLPSDVTEHFDIVGVDPRGLGASEIDCGVDPHELYDLDYTIDSDEDEETLLDVSEEYVAACDQGVGDVLPHLGTRDVARDIDTVRAAMGDEQANFLMFSYGTAIAQVYADLFPDRVRAMVIDGVLELGPTGVESATAQAGSFERALESFADDCDDDESCPIGPDAIAALDELTAQVEEEPVPATPRDLGPGELQVGLGQALYSEDLWPDLAGAIADGLDGDGTAMVALADDYIVRSDFDLYFAVNCLDSAWPSTPEELLEAGVDAGDSAPHFGEAIVNDYVRCSMWPVEAEPLEPPSAEGVPPVLVIGTTNDPATPYEQAERVAESLDDAVLLTFEGEGHGVVGGGVDCIDDAVARYLVDLDTPDDGTTCEP
jgi:pimeloyl-ACP methyl ester carboxylesterase